MVNAEKSWGLGVLGHKCRSIIRNSECVIRNCRGKADYKCKMQNYRGEADYKCRMQNAKCKIIGAKPIKLSKSNAKLNLSA